MRAVGEEAVGVPLVKGRPRRMIRPGWERVVIVASGPSLKVDDYAQAKMVDAARVASDAFRVIVVNDNWRQVPHADLLYAGDLPWWHYHAADVIHGFAGERWSQDPTAALQYGLHYVKNRRVPGLTRTDGLVHGGGNSGHQAIQLAYLLGAQQIALVAYDMMADPETKAMHHFGDHPREVRHGTNRRHWPKDQRGQNLPFHVWLERMDHMAPELEAAGVRVVNCSARTAITCFPRSELEEVLAEWVGQL